MPKKPRVIAGSSSGPLLKRDFDRFRKETFDPLTKRVGRLEKDVRVLKEDVSVLKDDVRVLKEDVRTLKIDVAGLKYDLKQTHQQLQEFILVSEKRHYEVVSLLDKLMTSFTGLQTKATIQDLRIGTLEDRVVRLEAP